jgi:tetratricopeptide (TPR) repeat protein
VAVPDSEQLEDIARSALVNGEEEAALLQLAPAAEKAGDARLWQFTGLLQRSLDKNADALRSFAEAARLAPSDPSIAHGRARVALEAGLDAVEAFERAMRLSPTNGEVMIGLTAAKFAAGRGADAEAGLEAALRASPLWVQGHIQLAQLRSMLGERRRLTDSIEQALATHKNEPSLWIALLDLVTGAGDFAALDDIAGRARSSGCAESLVLPYQAIAAAEQEQSKRADRLFEAMGPALRDTIPAAWQVRHLVRTGRIGEAIALIDRKLGGEQAAQLWPYASVAWRLAGDPRWDWLEAGGQLVSIFDLTDQLPPLDELAMVLRSLHIAHAEFLDQSVRGGTQTDGPLLSRIEPAIQKLRAAIVWATENYLADLPPPDPAHPLLREPRDRRVRFAGSWSVQLKGSGFHTNHVHPQGWISSALYVALPNQAEDGGPAAGWLTLGQAPPELRVNSPAVQLVEPKPGRLVLFPSWMWHGTVPFAQGERLTVAFDVRLPI